LFNLEGEVVGIITAITSPSGGSVGVGFAVPSNAAAEQWRDVRDSQSGGQTDFLVL
jgi:serine protease Do